jgi:adenosylhomocysteine nucleosidase
MRQPPSVLICFAVKEEAKPFLRLAGTLPHVQTVLTGMGPDNAETAIRSILTKRRPDLVVSSGFAGGLKPGLASGTVVIAADETPDLRVALLAAGARAARFHCADHVATTAAQKRLLHETTGADAVEMESGVIGAVCREQKVPCAIVRVILDTADEDLALDFNQLMTTDQRLDGRKLALALLKSPRKVPALLRLQQSSRTAAERLAEMLARILTRPA